jgi:iron complex outermembrane recepter protein
MKKNIVVTALLLSNFFLEAQQDTLSDTFLREVMVKSTWANEQTPMTFQNFTKKDLQQSDFAQDLPYLLQNTPSAVVSSDAGTGVGYTGIRIRGTDPTRINVTINGIPYNDAESQSVYWVDMNDIFGSTENIQIQRGVGTSTNGSGAFGGSINLNTNKLHQKAYGEAVLSAGSFNTQRYSMRWGSGLMKNRICVEGRLSRATSDSYVDRAAANLHSGDIGVTYLLPKASLRFNVIAGNEITYQAWNGLPAQYLNSQRTNNPSGNEKQGEPYKNQVDNYTQTHYQLLYNQEFTSKWSSSLALHLTRGAGYYEEYKAAQSLEKYGLPNIILSKDSMISATDLVRRRWLDNWFYGAVYGVKYEGERLKLTLGGAWNRYQGQHFGEVIWGQFLPQKAQNDYRWYDNKATKNDFNTYLKGDYAVAERISLYGDLQIRAVDYTFVGKDRNGKDLTQTAKQTFFNPKFGANYLISNNLSSYISYAVAQREPNRDDYVNSTIDSRPLSEKLQNIELGVKGKYKRFHFGANYYFMYYDNQLALSGKINDVGEYTRINIPSSYRSGIEMEANVLIYKGLYWSGNMTFSQNKINTFDEYLDDWSNGEQVKITHHHTDLSFSPNIIGSSNLTYTMVFQKEKKISAAFLTKYVGKQYIDNTSDDIASLAAYFQHDVRLNFTTNHTHFGDIDFGILINNIFNNNVVSNAWTYRYLPGFDAASSDVYSVKGRGDGVYNQIGYFPQAFRNVMLNLRVRLE